MAAALETLRSGPLQPSEQDAVLAIATDAFAVETLVSALASTIVASPSSASPRPWVSHSEEFRRLLPPDTPEVRRLCAGTGPAAPVQSAVVYDCEWNVLLLSAPGDLGDSRELLARFAPKLQVYEALLTDGLPAPTMPTKTKVAALRCTQQAALWGRRGGMRA